MTCIYKITSPSGKIYIGQTRNFRHRLSVHKYDIKRSRTYLSASIKKYGFDSHKFEIIHELPIDVDQSFLDTYEILYISAYAFKKMAIN